MEAEDSMTDRVALLGGVRVVDLGGEPVALASRVLADLGADVVMVEPPEGCALRGLSWEWKAWGAGKRSVVISGRNDPRLDTLLTGADIVIDTPGFPGAWEIEEARAPGAVWVHVTPFGFDGPRSGWRASDLGVMAASGNMWATGYPDRAPVRCFYPTSYAHAGGEVVLAALSGLWVNGDSGRVVDCSLQETVFSANLSSIAEFADSGDRGQRAGAWIAGSREIWPTLDGFVSLGVRGGSARLKNWTKISELLLADGIAAGELIAEIDWMTFNVQRASQEVVETLHTGLGEWFSRHTNQELYDLACEFHLFLAPAMSPREMFENAQLAERGFFARVGDMSRFPHRLALVSSMDGVAASATAGTAAPGLGSSEATWSERAAPADARASSARGRQSGDGAWSGLKVLEFGSGAAGPISTRYFAEHGATVLRIEAASRPDFLRVMALGRSPHGLEGSTMYDNLNAGKRNATFNLKDPRAVDLVRQLMVEWADAIVENFTPRAMKGFGLDYASVSAHAPGLIMVSACLNGQTGPHKDYPGFGSQGSALSGYTFLTGWADREPIGPSGTITDSLAPRYVAGLVAAALHYKRRTGRGAYIDVSQVESGIFSLSPWLLEADATGIVVGRDGNRSRRAVPHGVFPCRPENEIGDRWIAVACWTDQEWARLAPVIGIDDPDLATFPRRQQRVDDVEAAVAVWTSTRNRLDVAEELQALGIEAVPVSDFGDIHADPQVLHRDHFIPLTHPAMGPRVYERSGFRVSGCQSGYDRPGPTLGQDNDWVQTKLLGLSETDREKLSADGVFT
jgi:crotonobetainyl-CoA:carnitine CoA-transferase CaiB-like acyl-CoA transferase